jgi:hypothetical protein
MGGCLVAEAIVIPCMMLICDGFLLAWVLVEIRNSGFHHAGEDRVDPRQALELMPAAALASAFALPGRYVATLVFLASQHLPTSAGAGVLGRSIRWLLGWGLVDLQAASLVVIGLVGVTAWSRGSITESLRGLVRLLKGQGGHLVVTLFMAGAAACALAGLGYSVVLLLPPAGWVLPAADSYAHYGTLPVGLWTIAALVELSERTLPVARPAQAVAETADLDGANRIASDDLNGASLASNAEFGVSRRGD